MNLFVLGKESKYRLLKGIFMERTVSLGGSLVFVVCKGNKRKPTDLKGRLFRDKPVTTKEKPTHGNWPVVDPPVQTNAGGGGSGMMDTLLRVGNLYVVLESIWTHNTFLRVGYL